MQTFLPFPDFAASAKVLDRQRLGKQRVEAWQLVTVLLSGQDTGWARHPAAKMWRGYECVLCEYGIAVCTEWVGRGYKDTLRERFITVRNQLRTNRGVYYNPPWVGDPEFHRAHRSNLTRKYPEYYSAFWDEGPELPYVWPV